MVVDLIDTGENWPSPPLPALPFAWSVFDRTSASDPRLLQERICTARLP